MKFVASVGGNCLVEKEASGGLNPGSSEFFSRFCLVCGQFCDLSRLVQWISQMLLVVTSRAKKYKNIHQLM